MKTMNKKIVFLDVDGTLCLDDGTVPASAVEACKQARRNGHSIYLCTGRSKAELYDEILDIGFDGIIGAGGGYCESQGEVVFHKQVTPEQVVHAVDYFNKHNIDFYIESNGGLYASKGCVSHLEKLVYGDVENDEKAKASKAKQPHPFLQALIENESLYRDDINKICFLGNDKIDFDQIKKEFNEEYEVLHCTVPIFGDNSGELAVAGVHKANAIEELLAYLNEDRIHTIAIGDGLNDLEMLAYCEDAIAMGNAKQGLKDIADYVSDSHENDGVFKAFKKYQLI